jgi:hypothetical protein
MKDNFITIIIEDGPANSAYASHQRVMAIPSGTELVEGVALMKPFHWVLMQHDVHGSTTRREIH